MTMPIVISTRVLRRGRELSFAAPLLGGGSPGAPSKHHPQRGVSRRPRAVRVYQPSDPPELVGPTITMPRFR